MVPVDLVAAGTLDFGTTLLSDLTVAIQKGKPAISIAQIQQANGLRLVSKKTSGIETPDDFIGKSVGVWLGGWEAQFNALMAQHKIHQDQLKVVSQGWSMTPFIEGQLDVASAMIYNEYNMVVAAGLKPDELKLIDYADYGLDFPGDVLFTSVEKLKKDPDLCQRMVNASLRGWQHALDFPEQAVDIVLKYDKAKVQTLGHQLKMMTEIGKLIRGNGSRIGSTDPERVKKMVDLLHEYNIMTTTVALDKIYTSQFVESASRAKE